MVYGYKWLIINGASGYFGPSNQISTVGVAFYKTDKALDSTKATDSIPKVQFYTVSRKHTTLIVNVVFTKPPRAHPPR
jgi:hypothetical protein